MSIKISLIKSIKNDDSCLFSRVMDKDGNVYLLIIENYTSISIFDSNAKCILNKAQLLINIIQAIEQRGAFFLGPVTESPKCQLLWTEALPLVYRYNGLTCKYFNGQYAYNCWAIDRTLIFLDEAGSTESFCLDKKIEQIIDLVDNVIVVADIEGSLHFLRISIEEKNMVESQS